MEEVRSFKVGMCQMLVEGGRVERNLERAESMIGRASDSGCSIAVLPECLDFGWTHPSSRAGCRDIPGEHSDVICSSARDSGIYVVAGLTERSGPRIYNSAIMVSPQGEIIEKHRKINILTIAQDLYSIGDSLGVVDTPLARIGIDICADNFLDSITFGHSLARMGCQLLLSPSAWAVDADYDNQKKPYGGTWKRPYSLLGRMYDMTTIGVSCVGWMTGGPWKGRKCIGSSLAVGPGGKILAQGPYGEDAEEMVAVEVNPVTPSAKGTAITKMLRDRGYDIEGMLGESGYYEIEDG